MISEVKCGKLVGSPAEDAGHTLKGEIEMNLLTMRQERTVKQAIGQVFGISGRNIALMESYSDGKQFYGVRWHQVIAEHEGLHDRRFAADVGLYDDRRIAPLVVNIRGC